MENPRQIEEEERRRRRPGTTAATAGSAAAAAASLEDNESTDKEHEERCWKEIAALRALTHEDTIDDGLSSTVDIDRLYKLPSSSTSLGHKEEEDLHSSSMDHVKDDKGLDVHKKKKSKRRKSKRKKLHSSIDDEEGLNKHKKKKGKEKELPSSIEHKHLHSSIDEDKDDSAPLSVIDDKEKNLREEESDVHKKNKQKSLSAMDEHQDYWPSSIFEHTEESSMKDDDKVHVVHEKKKRRKTSPQQSTVAATLVKTKDETPQTLVVDPDTTLHIAAKDADDDHLSIPTLTGHHDHPPTQQERSALTKWCNERWFYWLLCFPLRLACIFLIIVAVFIIANLPFDNGTDAPTFFPATSTPAPTQSPTMMQTSFWTPTATMAPSIGAPTTSTLSPTTAPLLEIGRPTTAPIDDKDKDDHSDETDSSTIALEKRSKQPVIIASVIAGLILLILILVGLLIRKNKNEGGGTTCCRKSQPRRDVSPAATIRNNPSHVRSVFLSHTKHDNEIAIFVSFLSRKLREMDIASFLDFEGIRSGTRWPQAIENNCRECGIFVCILSEHYLVRHWCMRELDIAFRNHRHILPVLYEYQLPSVVQWDEASFRATHKANPKYSVSDEELDRWCRNVAELREIQDVRNDSLAGDSIAQYVDKVASEIVTGLEYVPDREVCEVQANNEGDLEAPSARQPINTPEVIQNNFNADETRQDNAEPDFPQSSISDLAEPPEVTNTGDLSSAQTRGEPDIVEEPIEQHETPEHALTNLDMSWLARYFRTLSFGKMPLPSQSEPVASLEV